MQGRALVNRTETELTVSDFVCNDGLCVFVTKTFHSDISEDEALDMFYRSIRQDDVDLYKLRDSGITQVFTLEAVREFMGV